MLPPRLSLIKTKASWKTLALDKRTMKQVEEIITWLKYSSAIKHEWGPNKKIKPGHKTLFYGPPGTGKTMTAALIGRECNMAVYKIDLSKVVSKYIGETEKNHELIFARAKDKGWILFFDEADALFGKRTHVRDAHDRYANQEIAWLLQRLEDYPGLVILATNFKNNIDQSFLRRFQSVIHFPLPKT